MPFKTASEILRSRYGGEVEPRLLDFCRFESQLREILFEAREARGLSQKELAKAAGVKESTIDNIEAGDCHWVALEKLHKICWAAGVRIRVTVTPVDAFGDAAQE